MAGHMLFMQGDARPTRLMVGDEMRFVLDRRYENYGYVIITRRTAKDLPESVYWAHRDGSHKDDKFVLTSKWPNSIGTGTEWIQTMAAAAGLSTRETRRGGTLVWVLEDPPLAPSL